MSEKNINELDDIKLQAISEIDSLVSVDQLENWRVRYLGRRGDLTNILRGISNLPVDDRKIVGAKANKLRILLGLCPLSVGTCINFSDFPISSFNGTSVGPKYPNEKSVSPLIITMSPTLLLMGDMGL